MALLVSIALCAGCQSRSLSVGGAGDPHPNNAGDPLASRKVVSTEKAVSRVYPTVTDPKSIIVCSKSGPTGSVTAGNNVITFAAEDCGGELPDKQFRGAISDVRVAGGMIDFGVEDATDTTAPRITFWARGSGGHYAVGATFIRQQVLHDDAKAIPLLISCSKSGSIPQTGKNDVEFTSTECGGALPGPDYVGAISQMHVNYGSDSVAVSQPGVGAPGIVFRALNSLNSNYQATVLFIYRPARMEPTGGTAAPFVIYCAKANAPFTTSGSNSYYYSDAACGSMSVSSDYSGMVSQIWIEGGYATFSAGQPSNDSGPKMAFWALTANPTASTGVIYVKRR